MVVSSNRHYFELFSNQMTESQTLTEAVFLFVIHLLLACQKSVNRGTQLPIQQFTHLQLERFMCTQISTNDERTPMVIAEPKQAQSSMTDLILYEPVAIFLNLSQCYVVGMEFYKYMLLCFNLQWCIHGIFWHMQNVKLLKRIWYSCLITICPLTIYIALSYNQMATSEHFCCSWLRVRIFESRCLR